MSPVLNKSITWSLILMLLGIAAMFAGPKWLMVFVPAAVLVWFGAGPKLRRSRN